MNESELQNLIAQENDCDLFPVVYRLPADLFTPLAAFIAISREAKDAFLFESIEGGEQIARYSFLGANPVEVIRSKEHGSLFPLLRERIGNRRVADVPGIPSFSGGAIAVFDFDTITRIEPSLRKDSKADSDLSFVAIFDQLLAFDHARQELNFIRIVNKDNGDSLEALLSEAYEEIKNYADSLFAQGVKSTPSTLDVTNRETASNWTQSDFEAAVLDIKEGIKAGDYYQVVLSQRFQRQTSASALSIYRALRSLNPSPYMFLITSEDKEIVGASPEMLVKCHGDHLEYRPIAGTRPRSVDRKQDEALAKDMQGDEKEVSEHVMLVDLGRNDLGRVSEYGSVKIEGLMEIEKFSHVQHLVSYLSSTKSQEYDFIDAFAACFPAGTVSGAPKVKAAATILKTEPTSRGIYSGAIGYFDYSGNCDTCIAIRTLVLENGVATVQAGAGIVADSIPRLEFEETKHKAAGLFAAVDLAETGKYQDA